LLCDKSEVRLFPQKPAIGEKESTMKYFTLSGMNMKKREFRHDSLAARQIAFRSSALLLVFIFSLLSRVSAQVSVENMVAMGRYALSYDDNVAAISYFNRAINARPTHAKAHYYRAYAKFILEDYVGAEHDCTTSISLNPFLVEVYQLRGLCRIHTENFAGAISDYGRVLHELPNDEAALFNRALCYVQLQQPDSAEAGMDTYLRLKPKSYRALLFKAQLSLERKDTLRAIGLMDTVLQIHPEEPAVWSFKGHYALNHEDFPVADSFLTQAIKYKPEPFENYLLRAAARHAMNKFDDAINDYGKVIERIPDHYVAHYNRALLRALVGDDNRAIDDFTFILSVEPDNTLARYNRALLRRQTGDLRGAIADFSALIHAYPDFLYGYQVRANLRRLTGDIRGARNDEAVIARHNLDVAFAAPRRNRTRKVRQRYDHSLDHYDQLLQSEEETTDTIRVFGDAIFGKIQNRKVEESLLPSFCLCLQSKITRGYQSMIWIRESEELESAVDGLELIVERQESGRRVTAPSRRVVLTTTAGRESFPYLGQHAERLQQEQERTRLLTAPHFALLRSLLARSMYDFDRALEMADSAQRLAPDTAILPLINRAGILMAMAETALKTEKKQVAAAGLDHPDAATLYLQRALIDLDRAIALSPSTALTYYNRGCVRALMSDEKGALKDFEQAIALDANFAEAHYNRGILLLRTGRTHEAAAGFSTAGGLGLSAAYALLKQTRQ